MDDNNRKIESQLEELRHQYKNIEIPCELAEIVTHTTEQQLAKKPRKKTFGISIAASFALCTLFTLGLNTNQAFAESVKQIPVLGQLAQVLTFTEYQIVDSVSDTEVKIPEVVLNDKDYESEMNNYIQEQMDQVLVEAQKNAAEYKEAYLSTGGKEENYKPVEIDINYEVKGLSDRFVSFVIYKTESIGSAFNKTFNYNINLATKKSFTLEELFGKDYETYLNNQINKMITTRKAEGAIFFEGDAGFQGILADPYYDVNQNFYLIDSNTVVIVFPKYTIAPGVAGSQEFKISIPQ